MTGMTLVQQVRNQIRRRFSVDPQVGIGPRFFEVVNIENVGDSTVVLDLADGHSIRLDVEIYRRDRSHEIPRNPVSLFPRDGTSA